MDDIPQAPPVPPPASDTPATPPLDAASPHPTAIRMVTEAQTVPAREVTTLPATPTLPDLFSALRSLIASLPFLSLLQPPQIMSWPPETVARGIKLAYTGATATFKTPQTRNILGKTFIYLLAVTVTLVVVTHAVFLPLRVIHAITSFFVRPVLGQTVARALDWLMDACDGFIRWFVLVTPEAGLYLIRYLFPGPLDNLFFAALRGLTASLALRGGEAQFAVAFARTLAQPPPSAAPGSEGGAAAGGDGVGGRKSWTIRLLSYLKRYAKRIAMLAVVYLISLIPIVGLFVWPLATFAYMGLAIGWHRAAWVCAAGLISPPWWRFVKGPLLRGIWSFRSLERELVEPYLCRSVMTQSQRRAWFTRNEALIAGFTLPFWYLLSTPWVGPLAFGIAQAAASRLCVEIFDPVDVERAPVSRRESAAVPSVVGVRTTAM
ncbi:hypothetical protein HDU87_006945 [Geranomyces variabilis]|uniref:Uncharacterized protein n=1 Tax=Geranomyces variabilis TaxID=109894 RepID=A0AAD5XQ74_9FUNG|nr:hypothetical protein HDU87_006945 [Geranomyces variabilis]